MSGARLPAHLEVAALRRLAQTEGGFATVLQRGEQDAGVILLSVLERGRSARLYERMPQLDGSRSWQATREEGFENPAEYSDYLARRGDRDPDTWVLELDVPERERFIAQLGTGVD